MSGHKGIRPFRLLLLGAVVMFSPATWAQTSPDETQGIKMGDYNVQESIEIGYRKDWITGNQDTYDTFVNLLTGPRLLDYTLNMRSLDHQGILFDNLNFSNFGYGGDPNDVSRLRIEKNQWYDFSAVFRRDNYFWDYNQLANPLNPVPFTPSPTTPSIAATNSPHSLFLVHRMQDYDLTLLPQSRVRFRLGYSRHVEEGPGLTTVDATDELPLAQNFEETTDAYRMGVDFRVLPKTTISYDQLLEWNKGDTSDSLANTPFLVQSSQFPGSVPVNLGINWFYPPTAVTAPCATPLLSTGYVFNATAATGLTTANAGCKMVESETRTAPLRNFMPTERLSFQSTYIPKLEMSASASYSHADNVAVNLYDATNEWTASTTSQVRDSLVTGPAEAKEIFAHANWSAIYTLTQRVRLVESIRYDQWQNPGYNNQTTTSLFATAPQLAGQTGILLPYAQFSPMVPGAPGFNNPGVCPAPYTAITCPQHQSYNATTGALSATSTAAADAADTLSVNYLGQRLISNTVQLEGDLTKRITARIGWLYDDRTIGQTLSTFSSAALTDVYYPGGAGGTAANYYWAARGNCAGGPGSSVAGGTCTISPNGDGSLIWAASPATISADLIAPRVTATIIEQIALFGVTLRPMDTLRINSDFQFGYNNYSYTRIWPQAVQSYKVHVNYKPKMWATVDAAVDIHENGNNTYQINNIEHNRTFSFSMVLMPTSKFAYTLGYNYTSIYLQTYICFDDSYGTMTGAALPTFAACPITNTTSDNQQGGLQSYSSQQNHAYSDVMWKPMARVTATLGYSGTFTTGNTGVLNAAGVLSPLNVLTPETTLRFNYVSPFASIRIDIYKGLSYINTWNYYGYNSKVPTDPSVPINGGIYALQPIGAPDFNGSTLMFAMRYAF